MTRIIKWISLALALAMLAACGTTGGAPSAAVTEPVASAEASEAAPSQEPETESQEETVTEDFDTDFLNYVHGQYERENYIISPLSFRTALVLAVEGADSETRSQLLGAMGFSSAEEMNQWYRSVSESVAFFEEWADRQGKMASEEAEFYPPGQTPEMPVYAYRVLNSIWNNTATYGAFLPDYVLRVAENYGAEADSVSADQITAAVNHWCDEATAGLIPQISDDLSECAAVLANAVYLKSPWVSGFSEHMTEPELFTDIDGNAASREMMKAKESYRFYEDADTKLVSIPLNGGLSFVAVLGDSSDWMAQYAAAEYTDVDLWLPKLDTESTFGQDTLIQYLKDRGAVNAFDSDTADFSRMADYPWYIHDILQKAKIKTDEDGLEAAAVTMIALAAGAAPVTEEPQYREFHADVPFAYYVVTTTTQTPLVVFAGQEVR